MITKRSAAKQPSIDNPPETRHERRRRRHRDAILAAADELMQEQGPDATTMQEISDRSDLALATIYSYFESKDQIIFTLVERTMALLGARIRKITDTFQDPGEVFAYGIRCLMEASRNDRGWHFLLGRPAVMADTMVKMFGRYGKTDLRRAHAAKRYQIEDVDLVWRQAIWAVAAVCIAVNEKAVSNKEASKIFDEAVVNILGMVGVERRLAKEIALRPRPSLPTKL